MSTENDDHELSGEDVERAIEEQQTLVDSSLEVMFQAYDDAQADGVTSPVIVLLDCDDPLGAEIARAWLGEETVDDAIAEHSGEDGSVTVFAAAFEWDDCKTQVPEIFPYLAEAFEMAPPTDGFLTIGVTAGGASAFTAPYDARPA